MSNAKAFWPLVSPPIGVRLPPSALVLKYISVIASNSIIWLPLAHDNWHALVLRTWRPTTALRIEQ
jgi:hypothetical protein